MVIWWLALWSLVLSSKALKLPTCALQVALAHGI